VDKVTRHPHGVYALQFGCYAESSPRESREIRAKLKLAYSVPSTKMQRVRRKSDKGSGRHGHKYLTPEQVEALINYR
jgi:hypothetical protein